MTNGIELRPSHKFINPEDPSEGQVPESVTFGKDFRGAIRAHIAASCQFGDRVSLGFCHIRIGEHVVVGNDVLIEASAIADRVTIGNNCNIGERSVLEDDVRIGDNVTIGRGVKLKNGVIVPSYWEIPYGYIVNPGLNGSPVLIAPQPQFRCNVTTNRW